MVRIGVGVELGKQHIDRGQAGGQHESLVAVVAGAHVTRPEGLGHGELGNLFAVTEDAELGLTAQHFSATDEACLAALIGQPIVAYDLFRGQRQGRGFCSGLAGHRFCGGRQPGISVAVG